MFLNLHCGHSKPAKAQKDDGNVTLAPHYFRRYFYLYFHVYHISGKEGYQQFANTTLQ